MNRSFTVSSNGGVDASAGAGPVVASAGFTESVADEPRRGYLTFDPAYMVRVDHNNDDKLNYAFAFGGTVGAAWGPDRDGAGFALGAFAGPVAYEHEGCRPLLALSAMVGIRYLGGLVEYFVLPKASVIVGVPCD